MVQTNTIRRDLYGVKEWDSVTGVWTYVRMTRCPRQAGETANDIRRNHSLGIRREAKVVHPSQRIVDLWVLAGNTIENGWDTR